MSRVVKAAVFRPSAISMAMKSGDEEHPLRWRNVLADEEENEVSNLDPTAFDQAAERDRMRREAIEHSRVLGMHYDSFISTTLAEKLAKVEIIDQQRARVTLRDGGQLTDEGPRIKLGAGSDSEIGALLELARAKRWESFCVKGSDQFVWRATVAALQDGRLPADKIQAMDPAQEHVVADAKRRFAEGQRLQQREQTEATVRDLIAPTQLPSMRGWRDSETEHAPKPAAMAPQRRVPA